VITVKPTLTIVFFGGGGGGTTCDVIRKKISKRNMIEEASVKTHFTKYPWGQCSPNMCVVSTRCIVPGGTLYDGQYGEAAPERSTCFSGFRYVMGRDSTS